MREWNGKVKHAELPVDQPPAVAFTAFEDVWRRATETEKGAVLCDIGAGRTLTFLKEEVQLQDHRLKVCRRSKHQDIVISI